MRTIWQLVAAELWQVSNLACIWMSAMLYTTETSVTNPTNIKFIKYDMDSCETSIDNENNTKQKKKKRKHLINEFLLYMQINIDSVYLILSLNKWNNLNLSYLSYLHHRYFRSYQDYCWCYIFQMKKKKHFCLHELATIFVYFCQPVRVD